MQLGDEDGLADGELLADGDGPTGGGLLTGDDEAGDGELGAGPDLLADGGPPRVAVRGCGPVRELAGRGDACGP